MANMDHEPLITMDLTVRTLEHGTHQLKLPRSVRLYSLLRKALQYNTLKSQCKHFLCEILYAGAAVRFEGCH